MYKTKKQKQFVWFAICLLWTTVLGLFAIHENQEINETIRNLASTEARSSYNKDLIYRRWAAMHGGVYVPTTDHTPPNPYLLNIPDRDIETPSGKKLTLVNPAYMTRQVHELGVGQYGTKGHITSLKPLRPENKPDSWEREALTSFKQGGEVKESIVEQGEQTYLRAMYSLVTEENCLKCHGAQGYQVGDIRGGISIAIPLQPYSVPLYARLAIRYSFLFGLWACGVIAIIRFRFGINKQFRQTEHALEKSLLAEKELTESEEKYRILFDEAGHGSVVADVKTGIIINCNHKMAELLGYKVEDLIGKPQHVLHPGNYQEQELSETFIKHKGPKEGDVIETQVVRKDGTVLDVEIKANRLLMQGREVLHGFFYDITERNRLMQEQKRSAQLAALGTVAAGVAHEINNPIQGIMNYATLIDSAPDKTERVADMAKRIFKESERIAEITKSLLYYSKDNVTECISCDLVDVVNSALGLIETKVRKGGYTIETCFAENLPKVSVHPQGIQQVIINLVDNAYDALRVKAIPDVDKVISVRVDFVETGKAPYAYIEVADKGVGMSEAVVRQAKEAFFSTKPSSEGTGLGLSIVNDIVKRHDGQIEIESKEGVYTKVKVELPIIPCLINHATGT